MLTRTVLLRTELKRAVTCCAAFTIARSFQQSLKTAAFIVDSGPTSQSTIPEWSGMRDSPASEASIRGEATISESKGYTKLRSVIDPVSNACVPMCVMISVLSTRSCYLTLSSLDHHNDRWRSPRKQLGMVNEFLKSWHRLSTCSCYETRSKIIMSHVTTSVHMQLLRPGLRGLTNPLVLVLVQYWPQGGHSKLCQEVLVVHEYDLQGYDSALDADYDI